MDASEPSEHSTAGHEGCTLLVFGIPAAGKSSLIARLIEGWLETKGYLNVVLASDNTFLETLERKGTLNTSTSLGDIGFTLTPKMRKAVAATMAKDISTESQKGQIVVMELATFEWEAFKSGLHLPNKRKTFAIYLNCSRRVSLRRQDQRARSGVFNAVVPSNVMDLFIEDTPPRGWLSRQFDEFWEFNTDNISVKEIASQLTPLHSYGSKFGGTRQLYTQPHEVH